MIPIAPTSKEDHMRTVLLTVVGLLLAGCEHSSGASLPAEPTSASDPLPTVEVVAVVADKLHTTARLPAELMPYESVALHPPLPGFVEEVLVDRGSRVRKGQLLARLSAPELTSQRAEAESKLSAARSTFERTRAAADTPGAIAKHDLEVAEAALRADEARVQSLKTL